MDQRKNMIGIKIYAKRKALKLTQDSLSGRLSQYDLSLSASSIGKIENGTRPVTDIQIYAFAKALETTPEWLISLKDDEQQIG